MLSLLLVLAVSSALPNTTKVVEETEDSTTSPAPPGLASLEFSQAEENHSDSASPPHHSPLVLMVRKDELLKECRGVLNGEKFEVRPAGRDCDLVVRKNRSEVCELELELSGWEGECEESWLEAGGRLECGRLEGRRRLPLGPELRLRAVSPTGRILGRQIACPPPSLESPLPVQQAAVPLPPAQPPSPCSPPLPPSLGQPCLQPLDQPPFHSDYQYNPPFPPFMEINNIYPINITQDSRRTYNTPNFLNLQPQYSTLLDPKSKEDKFIQGLPNPESYLPYNPSYPANIPSAVHRSGITVLSPGYPNVSPPTNCFMLLPVPPSCDVLVRFLSFDVGPEGACGRSSLEISGFRFCGCQTGRTWASPARLSRGPLPLSFRGPGRFFLLVSFVPASGRALDYFPPTYWSCQASSPSPPVLLPPPSPPILPPLPSPPVSPPYSHSGPCQTITSNNGYVSSNRHSNLCYRFDPGLPNFCGVSMRLEELQIPASPGCKDQYISFGQSGPKICGNNVLNGPVRLGKDDCVYTQLGEDSKFRASYQSLQCGCDANFRQSEVAIKGPTSAACTYTIHKLNNGICGLEVTLKDLNLDCSHETLHLGGKFYCGRIFKQKVSINFLNPTIEIRYERTGSSTGGNYVIEAKQIICVEPLLLDKDSRVKEDCVISLIGKSGTVQFSNAQNFQCKYQLKTETGVCWVRLDFNDVDIPISPNCAIQHITVGNQIYCGNSLSNQTKIVQTGPGSVELPYRTVPGPARWSFTFTQLLCNPPLHNLH